MKQSTHSALGLPDGGPGAKGNHEDGAHQGGQGHGRQSGS